MEYLGTFIVGNRHLMPAPVSQSQSTPFIICLKVEASSVLFLTQSVCMVHKQNTQNLYLQADDKRCRCCMFHHSALGSKPIHKQMRHPVAQTLSVWFRHASVPEGSADEVGLPEPLREGAQLHTVAEDLHGQRA